MSIRRQPSDFQVQEIIAPRVLRAAASLAEGQRPTKSTRFALYRLTKVSLTTPEAMTHAARALGLKPGLLMHAGLKDKHAQTLQHITIDCIDLPAPPPAQAQGERWSLEHVGYINEPAEAAWIEHNRFIITIRDLAQQTARDLEANARRFYDQPSGSLLIMNYFGEQRFGSARHGQGMMGPHLIKGDFETALRLAIGTPARKDSGPRRTLTRACATHWGSWNKALAAAPRTAERRPIEVLAAGGSMRDAFAALPHLVQSLAVEAYQSYLWNQTARAMVLEAIPADSAATTTIATDHGELIFPHAPAMPLAWSGLDVPTAAPELIPHMARPSPWSAAISSVLEQEQLTLESLTVPGLRRPSFGLVFRPLVVPATQFDMSPLRRDELTKGRFARTLCFDLPRGSYATIVLRALGH